MTMANALLVASALIMNIHCMSKGLQTGEWAPLLCKTEQSAAGLWYTNMFTSCSEPWR